MGNDAIQVSDIHKIYKKVYFSANELVKDAKVLFETGSYARAYYHAQLALEEYSKMNMLYAIALRVHNKHDITFNELALRLKDKNLEDDFSYGIVLLLEKDYIKYPSQIDSILHQPKLSVPTVLTQYEDVLYEDGDDLVIDLLEAYKELKLTNVLKNRALDKELHNHIYGYKKHCLNISVLEGEFVMPFEVITEKLCSKRLMSVLAIQRIYDISGYQNKEFELFKFDKDYYQKIEEKLLEK